MSIDQSGRTLQPDVAEPPADRAMLALQYLIAAAAVVAALLLASVR
jgi:hypothetical protein